MRDFPDRVTGCRAIMFDLLSGLLNSWALWNAVAGSDQAGMAWRTRYLELTRRAGRYRLYEGIIREAARQVGIPVSRADALVSRWGEIQPWPETADVLRRLAGRVPLAIATNSSDRLAETAVACTGVSFAVVATAEQAGYYKPAPQPYRMALSGLGLEAREVLFVAGSVFDIDGAHGVGMPVFWHNRLSLKLPDTGGPEHVADTLQGLPDML